MGQVACGSCGCGKDDHPEEKLKGSEHGNIPGRYQRPNVLDADAEEWDDNKNDSAKPSEELVQHKPPWDEAMQKGPPTVSDLPAVQHVEAASPPPQAVAAASPAPAPVPTNPKGKGKGKTAGKAKLAAKKEAQAPSAKDGADDGDKKEAVAVAEAVRALEDPCEKAWQKMKGELEVLKNIWSSMALIKTIDARSTGDPAAQSQLVAVIDASASDPRSSITKLKQVIAQSGNRLSLNKSTQEAAEALYKAKAVVDARAQLRELLERPGGARANTEFETLVRSCQLDAALESRALRALAGNTTQVGGGKKQT